MTESELMEFMDLVRSGLAQMLSDSMTVRWYYGECPSDPFADALLDRIHANEVTAEDRKWLDAMDPCFDIDEDD